MLWHRHLPQDQTCTSNVESLTVTETPDTIEGRHLDDEGKQVVNEGVESLVAEHAPREVSNRLEFVVDEQLGGHHDEACNNKTVNLRGSS